jgi:hypothetical protein
VRHDEDLATRSYDAAKHSRQLALAQGLKRFLWLLKRPDGAHSLDRTRQPKKDSHEDETLGPPALST